MIIPPPLLPIPTLALTVLLTLGIGVRGVVGGTFSPLLVDDSGAPISSTASFLPNLMEVVKPSTAVRSLAELHIDLTLELPPNHTMNREAPGRVAIRSPLVGDALIAESPLDENRLSLSVHWGEKLPTADRCDIVIEAAVYFCEESKKSICKIRSLRIFQPVTIDPVNGAERLAIQAVVPEN